VPKRNRALFWRAERTAGADEGSRLDDAMVAMASDGATYRLSSDVWPERERASAWREVYGRKVLRLEHEPLSDSPFHAEMTLRGLSDLAVVSVNIPPLRIGRTRELLADGGDNLILQIATAPGMADQLGREVVVRAGEGVVMSAADIGTFTFPAASEVLALSFPRAKLASMLADFDTALVRPVARESEALQFLAQYLGVLRDTPAFANAELQQAVVTHLYDLVALALGATRDAAEVAKGRGVRAARLRALKADALAHLGRADLSVAELARRHRVTPRYVQILFDHAGTTFSEFVREQRLARAYDMLRDPRRAEWTIAALAFEAGFGDVSHFNHALRQRYGATPSDVRADAKKNC
jgi:AraC-like DNA-binding protein